jgi:uncharacterized membrane protein YedE/YeeE
VTLLAFRSWIVLRSPDPSAYAGLALIMAAGLGLKWVELPLAIRVVVGSVIALFGFLLVTRMPDPIYGDASLATRDGWIRVLGVVACIFSAARPVFGVITISAFFVDHS